jgi:hypothetical protein
MFKRLKRLLKVRKLNKDFQKGYITSEYFYTYVMKIYKDMKVEQGKKYER